MLAVKTSLGRHLVVSDLSVRLLVGLDRHGQRPEALIPDGPIDQRRIHPGAERVCPAISDHAIPSFDEVWLTFRTSPDRYSPPVQEPVVAPV
jgi:hypothetical protein